MALEFVDVVHLYSVWTAVAMGFVVAFSVILCVIGRARRTVRKRETVRSADPCTLPVPPNLPVFVREKGLVNFRDLGGYPTCDGRKVRSGMLFRSAALETCGRSALSFLQQTVHVVIDLRARDEATRGVLCGFRDVVFNQASIDTWALATGRTPELDSVPQERLRIVLPLINRAAISDMLWKRASLWERLKVLWFRFCNVNEAKMKQVMLRVLDRQGILGFYKFIVDECQADLSAALRLVIEHSVNGVCFHCSFGKDRTGLLAAFLLRALDVPPNLVVHDYASTVMETQWTDTVFSQFRQAGWREAKAEVMRQLLQHVEERYGGCREYLDLIGVDTANRNKLKQLLLEHS